MRLLIEVLTVFAIIHLRIVTQLTLMQMNIHDFHIT